jgi:hypothetical protein
MLQNDYDFAYYMRRLKRLIAATFSRSTKLILGILIAAVLIVNADGLSAALIKGIYFEDSLRVDENLLEMRGAGVLHWFFFKVYVATLYLPPDVPNKNVLDDVPKKMVFHYLSDMKAEQFGESGEHLILRNVSTEEFRRIKQKLNEINMMYRDVKKGERYSLTYLPGKGTELALNGKVLGRIAGYDFASIYYRIWLGDNPADEELKKMLLNQEGSSLVSE